jgi:Zn finger protein HypA/HybF involved in hydrogenase expression
MEYKKKTYYCLKCSHTLIYFMNKEYFCPQCESYYREDDLKEEQDMSDFGFYDPDSDERGRS